MQSKVTKKVRHLHKKYFKIWKVASKHSCCNRTELLFLHLLKIQIVKASRHRSIEFQNKMLFAKQIQTRDIHKLLVITRASDCVLN